METLGIGGGGGDTQPTAKKLLISPPRKILLDIFISHYPKCHSFFYIKQQFSSHHPTLYKLHFQLQSLLLYHFFEFRLYMYPHVMLILINQYLLNVVCRITKALNGQISSKQHFYYPHLFHSHSLFYFKPYEISTGPTPVGTLWLECLIKYNGLQISGNKSDETPYLMS